MDSLLPTNGGSPTDQPKHEQVLTKWIGAITSFHICYHQLATYVDSYHSQQQRSEQFMPCLGQCPVDQMTTLLKKMQDEVNLLTDDMDPSNQSVAQWSDQRLIAHTRRLNRLSQQAQVACQLASQSAS